MMVVSVEPEPSLKLGMPESLFERPYISGGPSEPEYDIHPDGNRFVMIKELVSSQINIELNWFEVLNEKMVAAE